MSVEILKELCEERNIKGIAIIDDIFDVPDPQRLDSENYFRFRSIYNDDEGFKKAIALISGTSPDCLPGIGEVDDKEIAPLWNCVWKQELGDHGVEEEYREALRELFLDHSDDVLGMLETVVKIVSLFRDDLGLYNTVTVHGKNHDPDEVANAQIVVVDFFLGQDLTVDDALEDTVQVVTDVVNAARTASKAVPSFLLVSARPNEIDVEEFLEHAQLMKSRFRFFAKNELSSNQIDNMVNLHDLIDASDRTENIERLLEDWQRGARKAIGAVRKRMLSLDISDYVYLDCYRLKPEGRSIGRYLRWFLTESLNATVTRKLTNRVWQDAEGLKLFAVVDEGGQLDTKTLAKTFDGPSDSIAHTYGDILFDDSRGTGENAFPSDIPRRDLVEGDLFVKPKNRNSIGYADAEVWMVMTPTCDLIERTPSEPPKAKSVVLLPGALRNVEQESKEKNFAEDYFIRVRECGEMRLLQVEWDYFRPISISWTTICKKGPGIGFKRLGRIRELYFHKIKEEFANRFTRIGTEVAPLLPHAMNGEVLIAVVNGSGKRFKRVMSFASSDKYVWEIGPVRITRPNGKQENKHVYQATPQFIKKLSEILELLPNDSPGLKKSAEHGSRLLKDMDTYMDLVRPMESGTRGVNEAVEFRQDKQGSNRNRKTKADLIVATFVD